MQEQTPAATAQPTLSVEDLFLGVQESYEQAQARALEENKSFRRTEFLRMDKLGTYRLRVLPAVPNADGTAERRSYEFPVHQLLLELERPAVPGAKNTYLYVTVPRTTDAGFEVDIIDVYRRLAVAEATEQGDTKLAEKIGGGSFGGGLRYGYGHALYVLDLAERAKGPQLLTLSHAQFKDLDERKFRLWQKKLQKNPHHPCPISSVYNAYPIEIEKRKNGQKTEYLISIDNESDNDILTRDELTALMAAPRIPEVIYRYSRYQFEATVEFLKQCDVKYGMQIMSQQEMAEAVEALRRALPREDTSSFSFDKRTRDARDNAAAGAAGDVLSLDDLFERQQALEQQGLGDRTEQGLELRAAIREYIEREQLAVRITRMTTNGQALEMIEAELQAQPAQEPQQPGPEAEKQPRRRR